MLNTKFCENLFRCSREEYFKCFYHICAWRPSWSCDLYHLSAHLSQRLIVELIVYSNKKDTSDFHGTVSFDPIKMSQQQIYPNVYQTSDTQKLVIIWLYLLIGKRYWALSENSSFHYHQQVDHQNVTHFTFNGNQVCPTMKKHLKIPNVLIKRAALQFKIVNLLS